LQLAKALQNDWMQQAVNKITAARNDAKAIATLPAKNTAARTTSKSPANGSSSDAAVLASIVIPVFNNLPLTRDCIDSLYRTKVSPPFEVIVVDNASTDGTAEYLKQEQAAGRIRVLANPKNEGFAHACNQGAQAARSPLVLFLNNDTKVTPG